MKNLEFYSPKVFVISEKKIASFKVFSKKP